MKFKKDLLSGIPVTQNIVTRFSEKVLVRNCRDTTIRSWGGYRIYVDGCTLKNNYVMCMRSGKIVRDHLCALSIVSYAFP